MRSRDDHFARKARAASIRMHACSLTLISCEKHVTVKVVLKTEAAENRSSDSRRFIYIFIFIKRDFTRGQQNGYEFKVKRYVRRRANQV